MVPGVVHAAIAAVITLVVGVPAMLAGWGPGIGAAAAIGFYVGRERRQSEEWAGSNRIVPWVWKPRALRDAGWPALVAIAVAVAMSAAGAWWMRTPGG